MHQEHPRASEGQKNWLFLPCRFIKPSFGPVSKNSKSFRRKLYRHETKHTSHPIAANDPGNLSSVNFHSFGDHVEVPRWTRKALFYGKLPSTESPSTARTEVSIEVFSMVLPNDGLKVLEMHYAAPLARNSLITPCSTMPAIVNLGQFRHNSLHYIILVVMSMPVASKLLYDDGEACTARGMWVSRFDSPTLASISWMYFSSAVGTTFPAVLFSPDDSEIKPPVCHYATLRYNLHLPRIAQGGLTSLNKALPDHELSLQTIILQAFSRYGHIYELFRPPVHTIASSLKNRNVKRLS
ncbi:hypothetical protein HPB48_008780 [Haemaphysalis longicornis]|uniref:Uncharacterized protein n=1 Tax=Haemaphysalis longicornis TaxID=44386 RepID=A0A9J6FV88_HAELO|nr:hypothetical protein HPB48_008780 [Haemaphysalis longicornis]